MKEQEKLMSADCLYTLCSTEHANWFNRHKAQENTAKFSCSWAHAPKNYFNTAYRFNKTKHKQLIFQLKASALQLSKEIYHMK